MSFEFYNLTFKDRTTYLYYKEFKSVLEVKASVYTKEFIIGVDDYCLPLLKKQFIREGYYITEDTSDCPIRAYDRDTNKEQLKIYLTVSRLNLRY